MPALANRNRRKNGLKAFSPLPSATWRNLPALTLDHDRDQLVELAQILLINGQEFDLAQADPIALLF